MVRKKAVMPPSLQAYIHGANDQELDVPPLADAPEYGAGVHAAAWTTLEVAAGCLAPGTYADAPRYSVAPTRGGDAAGGAR